MTCFTTMSNLSAKFLKRSWVNGLGGFISFSRAMAMDCASKAPITMGSLRSPSTSFKMRAYAPFCVWLYDIPLIFNLTKLIIYYIPQRAVKQKEHSIYLNSPLWGQFNTN